MSNRDSFKRHIAAHSNLVSRGAQTIHIACDACYKSKVRCERGFPCLRCTSTRQTCIISRTALSTMGTGRAVNTLAESHTAVESRNLDRDHIRPGANSITQDIDANTMVHKVLQNEAVHTGRRASSITPPRATQSPPTTVAFDERQHPRGGPCLLTGIDDNRRPSWNVDETSLQGDNLSGLSTFQAPRYHGLGFDQQARKWLQDFCNEAR